MNLKQWQRSKKIKAEAEAAAKRTVERVLNAAKEPAMSEFKVGDWVKTQGWKGAKEEWLSMMDEEFKGDTCLDAWAVANCLHKGNVAKTMTRRYEEAVSEHNGTKQAVWSCRK
ncbi:TPA: hypothetical protein R7R87_003145 [Acinetobacter baumannii]|nr:hypothetical protein [Acinetobacter baumannii]